MRVRRRVEQNVGIVAGVRVDEVEDVPTVGGEGEGEEEVEEVVEEPEVESTEEVVEDDKEIFIETDLNFKSILEEINNESSD